MVRVNFEHSMELSSGTAFNYTSKIWRRNPTIAVLVFGPSLGTSFQSRWTLRKVPYLCTIILWIMGHVGQVDWLNFYPPILLVSRFQGTWAIAPVSRGATAPFRPSSTAARPRPSRRIAWPTPWVCGARAVPSTPRAPPRWWRWAMAMPGTFGEYP